MNIESRVVKWIEKQIFYYKINVIIKQSFKEQSIFLCKFITKLNRKATRFSDVDIRFF